MKKAIAILAIACLVASCTNSPNNKVTTSDAQIASSVMGHNLKIDTQKSSIYWKGSKIGGMHDGTIGIKDGNLSLTTNKQIASGAFTIDMDQIVNTDLADNKEMQDKLVGHLKSADFFDVATYPTALFTVTGITEAVQGDSISHQISGNLRMKDVEKNISFGAKITATTVKEGENDKTIYTAQTVNFTIDRTEWNVQFGSKKLFPDLKEFVLNDNIELKIIIVAEAENI